MSKIKFYTEYQIPTDFRLVYKGKFIYYNLKNSSHFEFWFDATTWKPKKIRHVAKKIIKAIKKQYDNDGFSKLIIESEYENFCIRINIKQKNLI